MLNKAYFTYLLKSKKYFLIIVCILQAIMAFAVTSKSQVTDSINYAFLGTYVFGLIIAFVLPLIVFSYIHNKKAIDTYFSLNMSRNALLFTGLLYCFVVAYGSYLISSIVTLVVLLIRGQGYYALSVLIVDLIAIVSYALVIVFNTFIYSLANTVTDGAVILLAYCFLPLGLYVFAVDFQDVFTIGVDFVGKSVSNILVYLSPVAIAITNFTLNGFSKNPWPNFVDNVSYFIVAIIYFALISLVLFKTFKTRKVERAGNYSDEFFAYPFVIGIYTILCLFIISVTFTSLNESIVLYALLFAAYFIANFIYKRKFVLSKKQIILFVVGIVLSSCFNLLCTKTKGFGLSNTYSFDYDKMTYSYSSGAIFKENEEYYDFLKEVDGFDESDLFADDYGVYISLTVHSNNKEVIDILENYRKQAIDNYYDVNYYDGNTSNLFIIYDENKDDESYSNYTCSMIFVDDLKKMMELDNSVEVTVYDFGNTSYHLIYEDDKFMFIGDEYYSVYSNFGLEATKSIEDTQTGSN